MAFVGSGVFAYPNLTSMRTQYEICLQCMHIETNHDNGRCLSTRYYSYAVFESRYLNLKDFEYYFFKRYQYLSERRI